jgi:hypothetical protein
VETPQHINYLKSELLDILHLSQPSAVVAGHYCLAKGMEELSSLGECEISSFSFGADLIAEALHRGINTNLVLWVNDIGIESEERQSIKSNYVLPDNYRSIVKDYGLPMEHVVVLFESTMRNKASVLLRKLYKKQPELFERVNSRSKDLLRCVEDAICSTEAQADTMAYTVNGPRGERLVVKDGPNPKCNLILATFFQELSNHYGAKIIVNVFNELYVHRLALGIHVSTKILHNPSSYINVFCDGEYLCKDDNFYHAISREALNV